MKRNITIHNRAMEDRDAWKIQHDAELTAARQEYDKVCETLSMEKNKRIHQEEIIDEYLRLKQEHEMITNELQQHKELTQQQQQQLNVMNDKLATIPSHEDQIFTKLMIDSFKGDYLKLRDNTRLISIIYTYSDTDIIFSDVVEKMNRHNKIQKRVLVVTNRVSKYGIGFNHVLVCVMLLIHESHL